jgi:fructose-1-phosphate kinase PfkB-like protein
MILTVALNPAVDWNIVMDGSGGILESRRVAGGKALNVSRVLNRLGTSNRAFGIVGGDTGKELLKLAKHEGLRLKTVEVASATRVNLTILSGGREWRMNGAGPRISAVELRRIGIALLKEIRLASIVVFSGSLPPGMPPRFLTDIIGKAHRLGKRVVVDTKGKALAKVKTVRVWLLKPNQEEWNSIRRSAPRAETVLLSLGSRGAMLHGNGKILSANAGRPAAVCTVGAGDSLLAGFLHHLLKTRDPAKALKFAVICGTASVVNAPGRLADLRSIRKLQR